jgi:c-di-GMP-related signal transduction protein
MDAILDADLDVVIDPLNIEPEIKRGLISGKGTLGMLLQLAEALESSDWERIDILKLKLGVDDGDIIGSDIEAWLWVGELGLL